MSRAWRGLVTALVFVGCKNEILLGGGRVNPSDAGELPVCVGISSRDFVTNIDSALGTPRAMAVSKGTLWLLSERGDANAGVLSRVADSGGLLQEIAQIGRDPVALALSADGAYAFVAASGSSQVARVDANGTAVVTNAGGHAAGIVADGRGGAFWTIPANDAVETWDFVTGAPRVLVTSPRATSIARDGPMLYITGQDSLSAFEPGVDATVRPLGSFCGVGIPAIDGLRAYCASLGTIARIDLASQTTSIVATEQTGASDVVVHAGRAYWRTSADLSGVGPASFVIAAPTDGIGGPAVIASGRSGALLLARDECALYYTEGRSVFRRAF